MSKPRLKKFYENVVSEDFILLYNFKNICGLTNFERGVLNSTSNKYSSEPISTMQSFTAWLIGTNQKCVNTRARKSIALFGIRQSNLLGLKVTCRRNELFALLDKLLIFVLPRLISNSAGSNPFNPVKSAFTEKCSPEISRKDFTFMHKSRSFFIISNKSALAFPEISQLLPFFDCLSGFALSCSITHKNKGKMIAIQNKQNLNLIKRQLLSAFQYPEIITENSASFLIAPRKQR